MSPSPPRLSEVRREATAGPAISSTVAAAGLPHPGDLAPSASHPRPVACPPLRRHHPRATHRRAARATAAPLAPPAVRLVGWRYRGALPPAAAAEALAASEATVSREWQLARAWLHHRLATAAAAE